MQVTLPLVWWVHTCDQSMLKGRLDVRGQCGMHSKNSILDAAWIMTEPPSTTG